MNCPRCNSEHTRITVLTETTMNEKNRFFHGFVWLALFVLWFIVSVALVSAKGTLLVAPLILFLASSNKRQIIKQTHYAAAICQECGGIWFPE